MAFQIAPSDVSDIIEALDFRESGDTPEHLVTIDIGHCVEAIVYIANPHNEHFLARPRSKTWPPISIAPLGPAAQITIISKI